VLAKQFVDADVRRVANGLQNVLGFHGVCPCVFFKLTGSTVRDFDLLVLSISAYGYAARR
jgi:hypothetical protein